MQRFPCGLRNGEHFRGIGAHHASADLHQAPNILLAGHATTPYAERRPRGTPAPFDFGFTVVVGDTAQDDGVNAEHSAELGRGQRVGTVAVREVLFL